MTPAPDRSRIGVSSKRLADAAGLGWVALCAFGYLSPALHGGPTFGPADLGAHASVLTSFPPPPPPIHNLLNGDLITQSIPWNTLDWQLVHHGQFPLWNDLSGNGVPQFLNFESAGLAVPTLLGYLAPLSVAFLVTVAAKMLIAGWGTYLAVRLLGARPLAATFGGTTFMLGGAFSGWLGWSVSGVYAWSGFILAGILLAYRPRGGVGGVALLAGSVAAAVYGGLPEAYVVLVGAGACLFAVTGLTLRRAGRGPSARAVARVGAGLILGLAMAAPLLLPGLPVLAGSSRAGEDLARGLPAHLTVMTLTQGFCGTSLSGSRWLCGSNYYESASYVGVVAVVFALGALVALWNRPLVRGLAATALALGLVVYRLPFIGPVQAIVRRLGLGSVDLDRALPLLGFVLAVLAALGLEEFLSTGRGAANVAVIVAIGLLGAVVALMWAVTAAGDLPPAAEDIRLDSLVWPSALLVGLALVVAGQRRWSGHRWIQKRWPLGLVVLAAQTAFLEASGIGLNTFARAPVSTTPAVAQIERLVGSALLAQDGGNNSCAGTEGFCGIRDWTALDFYPQMNILFGVHELAVRDPTVPQAYLSGWPVADAGQKPPPGTDFNLFNADVDTVALARQYGVSYVLVGPGIAGPAGMTDTATVAGLRLYSVPGSGMFTFGVGTSQSVLAAIHPDDTTYKVQVPSAGRAATLTARITDVPGWRARVDGHAVGITRAPDDLMTIDVPAGSHSVELTYAPERLRAGFVLAGLAVVIQVAAAIGFRWRRSRRQGPARSSQ